MVAVWGEALSQSHDRRDGAPDWIDTGLLNELDGRLWHATSAAAYWGILAEKFILASAPGKYNGFAKRIGGVSLFDLAWPDPRPPISHWSQWLSFADQDVWYWLEIDRIKAAEQILSPDKALEHWRGIEPGEGGLIIGGIEAVHLGPVAIAHVTRTMEISRSGWKELAPGKC